MAAWERIVKRVKDCGKLQIFKIVNWYMDKEISRLERANEQAEWDSHFHETGLRNHRDTKPYAVSGKTRGAKK